MKISEIYEELYNPLDFRAEGLGCAPPIDPARALKGEIGFYLYSIGCEYCLMIIGVPIQGPCRAKNLLGNSPRVTLRYSLGFRRYTPSG